MNSYQVLHSTNQTQSIETATGSSKASVARRITLVAALTGFAFVALAVQINVASDQPQSSPVSTAAISKSVARNADAVQSAPVIYLSAQLTNQAKSYNGNVMTYEHD